MFEATYIIVIGGDLVDFLATSSIKCRKRYSVTLYPRLANSLLTLSYRAKLHLVSQATARTKG